MSAERKPLAERDDRNRQAAEANGLAESRNPISRVALVSHNYNQINSFGLYDYSEHFAAINERCDAAGCDSILYSLWTWDSQTPNAKNHDIMFSALNRVQRVILEIFSGDEYGPAEVWLKQRQEPLVANQRFATSGENDRVKQRFIDDLPGRAFDDSIVMLCGESNIASTVRGTDGFRDSFEFNARLDEMDLRVIWNPIHDYMRRYEMKRKRAYYSLNGRWVLSVWNQGKPSESYTPWSVFHNGIDSTEMVEETDWVFGDRQDIRVGLIDVSSP